MTTVAFPRRAGRTDPDRGTTSARATRTATRSSTAVLLAATVLVCNLIGVVMVLSASSVASLTTYGSPWYFFLRQLMWTPIALAGFVIALRVDYHLFRRFIPVLLIGAAALSFLVLVPGIGIEVSGSRRWLGYGFLRLQPSELVKFALLLYCADLFSRRAREVDDWRRVLRPAVLVLVGFGALIMLQPDLGSFLVVALIVATIVIAGGARGKHLAVLGTAGVAAVTVLAVAEPYRRQRMMTFLHPFSDQTNEGYQIAQSIIAIGSGGWTGVGLGASRAKWNFLPNAHTDFIFAIIGEELGLVGGALVLGLFATFAVLGTRAAIHAPDRFGALVAAGITMWVVGQAVINIGAVVGLLPITGIPLPFVSFGGTALVVTMFASGILVNIARQGRRVTR